MDSLTEDTLEELDGQYREYVNLTKCMRTELLNSKDVRTCSRLLKRYRDLYKATQDRNAKALLNYWYGYFIKLLKTSVETQPLEVYAAWLNG